MLKCSPCGTHLWAFSLGIWAWAVVAKTWARDKTGCVPPAPQTAQSSKGESHLKARMAPVLLLWCWNAVENGVCLSSKLETQKSRTDSLLYGLCLAWGHCIPCPVVRTREPKAFIHGNRGGLKVVWCSDLKSPPPPSYIHLLHTKAYMDSSPQSLHLLLLPVLILFT